MISSPFRKRIFLAALLASQIFVLFKGADALAAGSCQALFEPREDLVAQSVREFSKTPDDRDNGYVTEKIPIRAESIIEAYRRGIFPWDTTPDNMGVWFTPPKRGILEFSELHIGGSDRKALRRLEEAERRGEIRVTFDRAFDQVIRACAEMPRLRRDPKTGKLKDEGTWISDEIIAAYQKLFDMGKAHSVEVWMGDRLVGGSYGTAIDGVYSGESMFHKVPDVAKLALLRQIEFLKDRGYTWMDTQVAPPDSTSLSVKWGAREITRDDFFQRIREAHAAYRAKHSPAVAIPQPVLFEAPALYATP